MSLACPHLSMSGDDISPVSVVVPAYNAESTIDGAMQGLLRQQYPRGCFEVIVVENGSRDHTLSRLTRYGQDIRVVHEKKQGAAAARNAGIRAASFPHIAFTDADCVPDPSWLRELMAYAGRHPRCDFVGGPIFAYQPRSPIERFSEWLWDQDARCCSSSACSTRRSCAARTSIFRTEPTCGAPASDTPRRPSCAT